MKDPFELDISNYFTEDKKVSIVTPYGRFFKEWNNITDKTISNILTYLINYPDRHNEVIPRHNSLRKLRWNLVGTSNKASNTGDIRIINAYIHNTSEIVLLSCYHKNEKEDLTEVEYKLLENKVKILKGGAN